MYDFTQSLGGACFPGVWLQEKLNVPKKGAYRGNTVAKVPTIAIVDDDESVRVATRYLVQSLGFDTLAFESAEDFLQSREASQSACIITDVNMPGLSGVELQRRLRAGGCNVPMIFITAFPDEAIEKRAMKAGAVCYLSKPFDGSTLIQCLELALQGDSSFGQ
jgi:FixJ family two-component response regulator